MKPKRIVYLVTLFLIIVIFSFALTMALLIRENSRCQENPLIYGAEKVYEQTNEELICSCSITGQSYSPFNFDRLGFKYKIIEKTNPEAINLTLIDEYLKGGNKK